MEFCKINSDDETTFSTHEEYKNGFLGYIEKVIEPVNEKKAEMIKEYIPKIKCLKCFDVKQLIQSRYGLPLSSLDCRGTYDIISCNTCSDGEIIHPTHELREKSNKRRVRYATYARYDDLSISLYHMGLENEVSIPDWDFMEDENITQTLSQLNIDADVGKVVDTIKIMVKAYFADPTSLTSFLENIQIKISQFCMTSKNKKEICRRIYGDGALILFELEKETVKSEGGFFNMNYKKQTESLSIHFMCIKPKNKAAEAICSDMMNKKVKNMVNKVIQRSDVNTRRVSTIM
jgi:hypothetical protein